VNPDGTHGPEHVTDEGIELRPNALTKDLDAVSASLFYENRKDASDVIQDAMDEISRLEDALQAAQERALPSAEELARFFHHSYERNAGTVGYKTRDESAVSWEEVPEPNRSLMLLTATDVLAWLNLLVAYPTEEPSE
jgi:hypothetical protein